MDIFIGILFAILWASAAIAGKFGIKSADPLTLGFIRFMIAGPLLLACVYLIQRKERFPKGKEWLRLFTFAFFNTTMYLGCFALAVKTVSAGLLNLFIAINPLIIVMLSAFWLKRKITRYEITGLCLCFSGLALASLPSFRDKSSSVEGVIILAFGMLAYCFASVYYSKMNVPVSNVAINAWQVFLGGLALLPFSLITHTRDITYDQNFFIGLFWLTVPVSIITMALWFYLLKKDTVKASQWLYLSPIAGYAMSYFILDEPITSYAIAGTVIVLIGLYVGKKERTPVVK